MHREIRLRIRILKFDHEKLHQLLLQHTNNFFIYKLQDIRRLLVIIGHSIRINVHLSDLLIVFTYNLGSLSVLSLVDDLANQVGQPNQFNYNCNIIGRDITDICAGAADLQELLRLDGFLHVCLSALNLGDLLL